jgi:hypothetical protein
VTVLVRHGPAIPAAPSGGRIDWLRSRVPDGGADDSHPADTVGIGLPTPRILVKRPPGQPDREPRRPNGPRAGPGRLTPPAPVGNVAAMTVFPVPRYLAETALRHQGVAEWIPELPALVADLAGRMADLTGIDARRARQWLFARSVRESIGSPLMRQVAARLAPA